MNRILLERIVLGFAFGIGCLIAYDYIMAIYGIGFWNGDFYARKKRISKSVVVNFPNGEPEAEKIKENETVIEP